MPAEVQLVLPGCNGRRREGWSLPVSTPLRKKSYHNCYFISLTKLIWSFSRIKLILLCNSLAPMFTSLFFSPSFCKGTGQHWREQPGWRNEHSCLVTHCRCWQLSWKQDGMMSNGSLTAGKDHSEVSAHWSRIARGHEPEGEKSVADPSYTAQWVGIPGNTFLIPVPTSLIYKMGRGFSDLIGVNNWVVPWKYKVLSTVLLLNILTYDISEWLITRLHAQTLAFQHRACRREGREKVLCSVLGSNKWVGQGSGCMSQSSCQSFDTYTKCDSTAKVKTFVWINRLGCQNGRIPRRQWANACGYLGCEYSHDLQFYFLLM